MGITYGKLGPFLTREGYKLKTEEQDFKGTWDLVYKNLDDSRVILMFSEEDTEQFPPSEYAEVQVVSVSSYFDYSSSRCWGYNDGLICLSDDNLSLENIQKALTLTSPNLEHEIFLHECIIKNLRWIMDIFWPTLKTADYSIVSIDRGNYMDGEENERLGEVQFTHINRDEISVWTDPFHGKLKISHKELERCLEGTKDDVFAALLEEIWIPEVSDTVTRPSKYSYLIDQGSEETKHSYGQWLGMV